MVNSANIQTKLQRDFLKEIVALALLCLLLFGGILYALTKSNSRRPNKFLIPEGYVGWVIVEYRVKNAPALAIENGHYLYTFARNGTFQTSSSLEYGWAHDEYWYYSLKNPKKLRLLKDTGWGRGGHIWAGSTSDGVVGIGDDKGTRDVQTPPTITFFVGTEQQFNHAGAQPHSRQMRKLLDK